MNEAVRQLFDEAASENAEAREEAILQIAMLLERHSPLKDSTSFYQSIQHPELANVKLDASEQQQIIDMLFTLVLSATNNASMVWALGKVKSPSVLGYLVDLVCSHNHRLSDDAKHQALVALNRFLSVDQDDPIYPQIRLLATNTDFRRALEEIAVVGQRPKLLVHRILGRM